MAVNLLCINSGSSSLKFALYQFGETGERVLADGIIDRIGLAGSHLRLRTTSTAAAIEKPIDVPDHTRAVYEAFASMEKLKLPLPDAVGHRIVHGGAHHIAPERVDWQLIENLRRLVAYAPLHLPAAIEGIEAVEKHFPHLPQVACFDTA